jgi:hypothetical protein
MVVSDSIIAPPMTTIFPIVVDMPVLWTTSTYQIVLDEVDCYPPEWVDRSNGRLRYISATGQLSVPETTYGAARERSLALT